MSHGDLLSGSNNTANQIAQLMCGPNPILLPCKYVNQSGNPDQKPSPKADFRSLLRFGPRLA